MQHNKGLNNLGIIFLKPCLKQCFALLFQVAEARKQGDIGETERRGETKKSLTAINANVVLVENMQAQVRKASR